MGIENPFRSFWLNVLDGFTPDMALYLFIFLAVIFLFAVKERIVFLIIADTFFLLTEIGLILYKWGF